MTKPKPGTKLLPLGTSIFVSVFVSVVLVAVCDDDVVADDDASAFGVSTVICICISTGAAGGTSIGVDTGTSI
jgi:hypothetical protein